MRFAATKAARFVATRASEAAVPQRLRDCACTCRGPSQHVHRTSARSRRTAAADVHETPSKSRFVHNMVRLVCVLVAMMGGQRLLSAKPTHTQATRLLNKPPQRRGDTLLSIRRRKAATTQQQKNVSNQRKRLVSSTRKLREYMLMVDVLRFVRA